MRSNLFHDSETAFTGAYLLIGSRLVSNEKSFKGRMISDDSTYLTYTALIFLFTYDYKIITDKPRNVDIHSDTPFVSPVKHWEHIGTIPT